MKKLFILCFSFLVLVGCGNHVEKQEKKSSQELYQEYQEAVKAEGKIAKETEKKKKIESGNISFEEAFNQYIEYVDKNWPDNKPKIYKFNDSGHFYKMYIYKTAKGYSGYGYMGIVHDPDCPCKDEK